jgi:DNA-directed RNA polymerase subunit RPC12/RpoP
MPKPMVKSHVSIAQGLGDWHARNDEDENPLAPTSEEMGLRCPKCSHWGLSGFDFCGEFAFVPEKCRNCGHTMNEAWYAYWDD